MTVTKRERMLLEAAADGAGQALKPFLAELEKRVEELEKASPADYVRGGWRPDETYQRGSLVQRKSSTYIAMIETQEEPGQSSHWRRIA